MPSTVKPAVALVLPVLEPAGAERIVAELALRLPRQGFATSVICLENETAPIGTELAAAGVPVFGCRLSRRRTLACAKGLLARLPQTRPLIVHSHLFHANLAARLALARIPKGDREQIKVLGTVHVAERRFRPWQFTLDRVTAHFASAEVCVSRAVAQFQAAHTGLPETFFRVVENGIDLSRFTPISGQSGSAGQRVISVGRLDPQKDYATLLHAWKHVQLVLPGAELEIAGEGPERARLSGLCESLSLKSVRLRGFVQDIPEFLHSGQVYVQPSAWEGFGLAVAEAMACALPVIVSDADSLPELVCHEKTGLVIPKGRPEALSAAIVRLLKDKSQAGALAAAAREEALKRFAVERMVSDYARLYLELLESTPTSTSPA